jgi:hypothetical protein
MKGKHPMQPFRQFEQHNDGRPQPVSPGVVTRLEGIYEVDPALMGQHFAQQDMPIWDTRRIVDSRSDHLDWMHRHFALETLVAGEESELDLGPG